MKKFIVLNLMLLFMFISSTFGEKALSINKSKGMISYKTGNFYFEKKDYSKAIRLYEKAILENYEDNVVYYKLSICYKEVNKYIKSINCIARAITLLEIEVKKVDLSS